MDLKFVFVIHRHGDRSPLMNYFKSTANEARYDEYWKSRDLKSEIVTKMNSLFPFVGSDIKKEPYPYGELTDVGLPELEQLGQKLKEKYVDEYKLISIPLQEKEIVVNSTPFNRTIESVQGLLCGFLNINITSNISEESLESLKPEDWYPEVQSTKDQIGFSQSMNAQQTLSRLNEDDWMNLSNKYNPILRECLEEFTFLKENNNKTAITPDWSLVEDYIVTSIHHKFDILPKIEKHSNLINKIAQIKRKVLLCYPVLTKSYIGNFYKYIYSCLKKVSTTENYQTKMMIYSGHDTNLLGLLYLFSSECDFERPEYASHIEIELYLEKETSKYFFQILYQDKPIKLNISPEANGYYPLDSYMELAVTQTKYIIPKELYQNKRESSGCDIF